MPTDPQAERDRLTALHPRWFSDDLTINDLDGTDLASDLRLYVVAACNALPVVLQSRDDLAGQVTRLTEERDALRAELLRDRGGEILRANVAEREVATLTARVQRAETALRELEWMCSSDPYAAEFGSWCPCCGELRRLGHSKSCGLAAALGDATP